MRMVHDRSLPEKVELLSRLLRKSGIALMAWGKHRLWATPCWLRGNARAQVVGTQRLDSWDTLSV